MEKCMTSSATTGLGGVTKSTRGGEEVWESRRKVSVSR